jgi:acetoin:2,6-dichlorophenolindophenol oxidoreductase subunit beta
MIPDGEYLIPFGQARICREGSDLTLVAVGRMVQLALEAAARLEQQGVSVEVIDPRTIVPLDRKTIVDSIRKTGRVAIVDEAPATCGFSGELFAIACEDCFDDLDGPPLRICSLAAPNPFSPVLENQMIPSLERVVSEIQRSLDS